MLAGGVYMEGGSGPRVRELFALECENGPFTSCGIYVWGGSVVYVARHHKAKRQTNREFYVVRFLPARLSRTMYLYLVYIRRLASLLRREQVGYSEVAQKGSEKRNERLLFHVNGKAWPTSRLTEILVKATSKIWNQAINVRLYRQLAIAITEKHVREVHTPFNRYDDLSSVADRNAVFAWQSGHRPLQRETTYGLDGAYPFRLQPALLRASEWASTRWHDFLHQPSKRWSLSGSQMPISLQTSMKQRKRSIAKTSQDALAYLEETNLNKRRKVASISDSLVERNQEVTLELGPECESDESFSLASDGFGGVSSQHLQARSDLWIDKVLCVLLKHQVLICLLCRAAVKPDGGIVSHFRRAHQFKGVELQQITAFCAGRSFQDPFTVPLPKNGSKLIPELPKWRACSCKHCNYITINRQNMSTHLTKLKHPTQADGKPDWVYVVVQMFSRVRYIRFRTVEE
ncbi:uncharacterized protein FMAN_14102 [Fusarium mangiferae]|uniref:Uncharacterized protein n=1 Tax=Fusarium mangiferae TaxID=192010 RepID=A0A1L7ULA7_FUSMA|nr:uncharacterized protein FMAN_14102 [Fusarium mangiferae]CVL08865.1 uncharacterized protein FMAN_14102 [Fusarium mangiferae]